MTPRRMNQILTASLILLVLMAAVGLYFANKKLTLIAQQTAHLKAQVEVGNYQIATYEKTKSKIDSLDYVEALAAKVLPEEQEQSLTVAELSEFALRSRLSVAEITFAELSTTKTTTKSTGKSTVKTAIPKGVSVIPISIKFRPGSRYDNVLEFLKSVEQNRRKMQVTNISLTPDEKNRMLLSQVSVDINLYARDKTITSENK